MSFGTQLGRLIGSTFRSLVPSTPETLLARSQPHVLFTAREGHQQWDLVTDTDIGGSSSGTFRVLSPEEEREDQITSAVAASPGTSAIEGRAVTPPGIARFAGLIHKPAAAEKRGAFVALRRRPWDPPLEIEELESIEICLRSDGRRYALNLNVEDFGRPDDTIYQVSLEPPRVPVGCWTTLRIPLEDFVVTARGRALENQRRLDGDVLLSSMSLLLAEKDFDGTFRLDISHITACPF